MMKLRKFDNVERVVKESGSDEARDELRWLLKLAKTNFAACYETGSPVSDAYREATTRIGTTPPLCDGEYISRLFVWLYAQAKEKCVCQAPSFITGCDNAVAAGEDSADECACTTGECPWTLHTGMFM